jgi:hypothetical protein
MLQPGAVRAHIKKGNSRSDSDGCSDEGRHRKLVWIEQQRFRGFGCSECAWVFNPSSAPNSELQRDKELKSLCCMFAPITQEHEH